MIAFETLEKWAQRPEHYPRYSRGALRSVGRVRLASYLAFFLLGSSLAYLQGRPSHELMVLAACLFVGAPLSIYLSIKSRYPLETFAHGFLFDGTVAGYLTVIGDLHSGLIVAYFAVQLCDGVILQGFRPGMKSVAAFVVSVGVFHAVLEGVGPLSGESLVACWLLVLHAVVHLSGSFHLAFSYSEGLERRELQLKAKNQQIRLLNQAIKEQVLARYLPPDLIDDIFAGKITMDTKPHTKTVTVLFSDLSGFTRMSEKHGAEFVSDFLNDYLTAMNETIFAHQGTIDKFIGDAIMVIFGAPQEMSEQEQADNACRCALAMQAKMVDVTIKWESRGVENLSMRIGIHQGPAVVGNFGSEQRVDYTAIGPTVNLASRIETACEDGAIYVSESVRFLVDGSQETEGVGAVELKGIEEAVSLFKLKQT